METLLYITKINLYWMLFYTCYRLLLSQHTFFRLNRFYLIGALILSLVLPAIRFVETEIAMPEINERVSETSHYLISHSIHQQFNWPQLLLIIYAAGVLYMLFILLKGFYNLFRLINQGEKIKFEDYTLILLPEVPSEIRSTGSFSFFNFLVVSYNDYENSFDTVLSHEQVHIKQLHSLDILFIEVLKVLFWFNPVIWFYKFSVRQIHEFLADQQAENRDLYAEFLVSYAQSVSMQMITNNFFNTSILKERIRMIYKNRTSNWLLYKYLTIIPVLVFTVLMVAGRKRILIEKDFVKRTNQQNIPASAQKPAGNIKEHTPKSNLTKKASKSQTAANRHLIKKKKPEKKTLFTNYKMPDIYVEQQDVSFLSGKKSAQTFDFSKQKHVIEIKPVTDLKYQRKVATQPVPTAEIDSASQQN